MLVTEATRSDCRLQCVSSIHRKGCQQDLDLKGKATAKN